MFRISKLTDYGTVILACLAAAPDRRQTATAVAARTRLGLPTVSKLLKNLHRAGLVTSARGAHGGYQIARTAPRISAAAIIDAASFRSATLAVGKIGGAKRSGPGKL